MGTGNTTVPAEARVVRRGQPAKVVLMPALVLADSAEEPWRRGEVAILSTAGPNALGRGTADNQVLFKSETPGKFWKTGTLVDADKEMSREEVRLTPNRDGIRLYVEAVGRNAVMLVNGIEMRAATLVPGDILEIPGYVFIYCVRPAEIPESVAWPHERHVIGDPDPYDYVGDSPAAWAFRELLARVALSDKHVLILGPTGVGKELVALSIRGLSRRADGPWIVCNAAGFTEGLIDNELFGGRAKLTDGNMPATIGLVEAAEDGFIYFDEIGDMPRFFQTKLLRALEGSYRRQGETQDRRCNFRCIGATNSPVSALEGDVFARLKIVVEVPPLNDRRQDLPLLIRARVLRDAAENPALAGRFVRRIPGKRLEIAIDPEFMVALLRHNYVRNVRELDSLLEDSYRESEGDVLVLPKSLRPEVPVPVAEESERQALEAVVARHAGNITAAAKELGMNRYVLGRKLGKHKSSR